jgi:hypothetical protein
MSSHRYVIFEELRYIRRSSGRGYQIVSIRIFNDGSIEYS